MIRIFDEDGLNIEYKHITFNGGEEHIKLSMCSNLYTTNKVVIECTLKNSSEVMKLLLITDAIRQINPDMDIVLFMPYVPYGRQDRVCVEGEALSIKVFANLINSQNYSKVLTVDNHSDVSTALLDRCTNYPLYKWFDPDIDLCDFASKHIQKLIHKEAIVCAPDAGALKKTYSFSKYFGGLGVIAASKVRNVETGDIIKTEVYAEDLTGKTVFIVDDIIDGGYTFIKLAEKLRELNAEYIYLVASHGIFSKGSEVFRGLIDHVYVSDSIASEKDHKEDLVSVIPLEMRINAYV